MTETSTRTAASAEPRTPAEEGMWLFVLADLCVFTSYFVVFLLDRAAHPDAFAAGRAGMDRTLGGVNTLLLLVGSWAVAHAVGAAREGGVVRFRRGLGLALALGAGFVALKSVEYGGKFSAGLAIDTDVFHRDYFAFTGFHLLHVLIGMSLLGWCRFAYRTPDELRAHVGFVEGTGLYWHMVDLVWVVLFALVYLVP